MTTHFLDLTLGTRRRPACGAPDFTDRDLKTFDDFSRSPDRCAKCEKEYEACQQYMTTCRICSKDFDTPDQTAQHEQREHVLSMVSDRKESPPCFVVDCQGHYDRPYSKARTLAMARAELRAHFETKEFDFIPDRHIINSQDSNTIILGYAYATWYLVVPR